MSPIPRSITDTELEVLKVLWDLGPSSVRVVLEALARQGRVWAYTTVQTLLSRLEQKGFVTSSKEGRAMRFSVAVSRERLIRDEFDEMAQRLTEGAAAPLLLTLVEGHRFTPEQIARFRRLLDAAESPPARRGRKPSDDMSS